MRDAFKCFCWILFGYLVISDLFFVKFVSPRYEFRSRYDLAPSAHSWILIKRFKIFQRMIWLCNIQRFCLQTRQFIMFIDEVYQPVIATAPYSVARLGQPPNHLSVLMSFSFKQTRFVLINICFRWIYCCSLLFYLCQPRGERSSL